MGHFAAMRKWLLFLLGVLVVEFIVAPLGGRVFDRVFPEERGFTGMIPDIPFYQWGYASILALGLVLGIAFARWQARRAAKVISSQDDIASPKALPIVAAQEEAVLSLANDDDHVHKRIPDIYGSHAIRAKIEAKYVDEGLPILHDISRWHDGAWHSLNSRNPMTLGWAGRHPNAYKPHSFATRAYFVVLNYHESEKRLELPSDAVVPSFGNRKELPLGKYRLEIEVECRGGVACRGTFIVDWFGTIEDMFIEKRSTQTPE